ncbi:MAG: type VI secretion system baseplate subunit TssG [bacterium]|nr:type VI secretion system baseplate subunit TssG [bacterium]
MERNVIETISFINNKINSYDFFQVVRILETLFDDNPLVGSSSHPVNDFIKFKQNPGLKYYTSDINRCRFGKNDDAIEIVTNFVGLLGSNGIMPFVFTEEVLNQIRKKNLSLLDFLNIFHHRLISFLYKAWAINVQIVSYEKGKYDHFSKYLYSLIGNNYDLVKAKSFLHHDFKLYFASYLIHSDRSFESINSIIKEYFKVDCRIEEFQDNWIDIPDDSRLSIVANGATGILGRDTYLGDEVWNCTSKFKICLGPMPLERYNSLLPGTIGFEQLIEIIKFSCSPELNFSLCLILDADSVPEPKIGSLQLGYNTWLTTEKCKENKENLYIDDLRTFHYE